MRFDQAMKILIGFILVALSSICSASETYCDKVESKGEGHWPISEVKFTKERYDQALKFLTEAPDNIKLGMDYVSVETELVFIEGYLIKSSIRKDDPITIDRFCEFVKKEAYVRH